MKKLLIILLCLPMIGFGQDSQRSVSYSSMLFGVSQNKLTGSDLENYEHPNLNFGISFEYPIGDKFSLNGKLLYVVKGNGAKDIKFENGNTAHVHNDLKYIVIPCAIQRNWQTKNNKWRFFVNLGFFTGYLLDFKQVTEHSSFENGSITLGSETYQIGTYGNANDLRPFDFGYVFGYGFSRALNSKWSLMIDGHVQGGLINIDPDLQTRKGSVTKGVKTESLIGLFGISYNLSNEVN